MFRKKKNCGQTATEYALLLAVVLASFVGMQTYVKRGIQGVIRNNTDEFGRGNEPTLADTLNFDPQKGSLIKSWEYNSSRPKEEKILLAGGGSKKILTDKGIAEDNSAEFPEGEKEVINDYLDLYSASLAERGFSAAGSLAELKEFDPLENNSARSIGRTLYNQGSEVTRLSN